MRKKYIDNAKLGLFVLLGLLFLIFSLYMIGKNRSLFGSTFTLYARFNNVNGLVPGNNVRFSGIDVGTVRKIEIINDTSIHVTLVIDKKVREHIRQNALASIGTDGLIGNKLININAGPGLAESVEEGSILQSLKPVETDDMLRTLNTTNTNIAIISRNLREITVKLNSSNSLWTLLSDSLIANDIKMAAREIRKTGHNTSLFTEDLNKLAAELKRGEGLAGSLLTDTVVFRQLDKSLDAVHQASTNAASLTNDLKKIINDIEQGKGTVGVLLADSVWAEKLHHSILNVEEGTARFNENMEAMRHNFLFRGYFRRQEKKSKQE